MPDHNTSSRKRSRTSEPPNGPLTGQKRDKYTATACNECRKRKIKCTGKTPCRRCESYELRCAYPQSSNENSGQLSSTSRIAALEQNLSSLQAQVEELSAGMKQRRESSQHSQNSSHTAQGQAQLNVRDLHEPRRSFTTPTQPRFIGPTSSAYNFNVANNTLQMMGIQPDEAGDLPVVASPMQSGVASPEPEGQVQMPYTDPLLSIDIGEIYRTIDLYQEELHPIYPFVPLEEMIQLVPSIYEHLQHRGLSSSTSNPADRCCAINDQEAQVLKLIVATALVVEGRGQSSIGQYLIDSVDSKQNTSAREVKIDLHGLRIFTLTSIYFFHADETVLAWRTIGFAARIALEIGLHRRESLEQNFSEPQEREWAIKLFWCIYVLDRRWSFGIGMPFALQDSDIDPDLPHLHDSEPYLDCLIAYGRICSKVWTAVAGYGNKSVDKETVEYLDFRIQQWVQSIPTQYQLLHPRLGDSATNQPRSLQRLRVLLYIRANQMRSYIHRHNVLSASNIAQNLAGARLVTDIAKDTIRVLVHLRETSTIYDTQQSAFNYFLVSAISAIFLAVCHAPAEFSHSCRNEFYNALGILNDFSAHSYISRRLWKSVRGLRNIAPKLGLAPIRSAAIVGQDNSNNQSNNMSQTRQEFDTVGRYNAGLSAPSSSLTAMEMPGASQVLQTQNSNPPTLSTTFAPASPTSIAPLSETSGKTPNIHQMGNELTTLFEAFDNFVNEQQTADEVPQWMTEEEIHSLRSGVEISRLFEELL